MDEILTQTTPNGRELGIIGEKMAQDVLRVLKGNLKFETAFYGGDEFRGEVIFDPSEKPVRSIIFIGGDGRRYALSSSGSFITKDETFYSRFCFGRVTDIPNQRPLKIDKGIVVESVSVGKEIMGSVKFVFEDGVTADNQETIVNSKKFIEGFVTETV